MSCPKELIRRSVLEDRHDPRRPAGEAAGGRPPAVTGAHLTRALDELLGSAQGE